MERIDVIEELRRYCEADVYQKVVSWPTPMLKSLLTYFVAGGEPNIIVGIVERKEDVDLMKDFVFAYSLDITAKNTRKRMFFGRLFRNLKSN